VFTIAAINGEGTKPLIYAIQEALEQMAPVAEEPLESPEDES
jgi:GTP-binding protein